MSQFPHIFPRLFRRAERRFRISRPGSVLILCVALLVLLALIGTAMISTSRIDRYTSQQNTTNTQVDLLVEGVKKMAEGMVVGDLFDDTTGQYRPPLFPPFTGNSTTYDHWDMPSNTVSSFTIPPENDFFLASRYPDRPDLLNPYAAGATNTAQSVLNPIFWRAITAPLTALPGSTAAAFEDPSTGAFYTFRTQMCPSSVAIGGITYPALTPLNTATPYLAADADGDGIADSGLCPLPVGSINGITYFAGVRIVDNNSAINVNTALSRNYEFTSNYNTTKTSLATNGAGADILDLGGAGLGGVTGFFRSDVGLMELLQSYNVAPYNNLSIEMRSLNEYRWGATTASTIPVNDTATVQVGTTTTTKSFTYNFQYLDQCDAMENGLSRRLDNPDQNSAGPSGSIPYASLSLSDSAALASKFCIYNSQASPSTTENLLNFSLVGGGTFGNFAGTGTRSVATSAYSAAAITSWYGDQFYWDNTAVPSSPPTLRLPLRSMLVTRNPVSNVIPAVTVPDASSPPVPNPLDPGITMTSDSRILTGMPAYRRTLTTIAGAPGYTVTATKTDINSASFEELWRAYWSVMADNSDPTQPPFPTADDASVSDPGPPIVVDDRTKEGRMFRSTWRLTGAAVTNTLTPPFNYFKPSIMLQLRSALAAINAVGLRSIDADELANGTGDVASHEIPLYDIPSSTSWAAAITPPAQPLYTARVYGIERQPFITEVYANTFPGQFDSTHAAEINQKGYVAIELYNPYTKDLILNNWTIGVTDRRYLGAPGVTVLSIGGLNLGTRPTGTYSTSLVLPTSTHTYGNNMQMLGGGQIIIPAGKRILLENYPPGGTMVNPNDALFRPDPFTAANNDLSVYVPNLSDVINDATVTGGELVLLRPHCSGLLAAGASYTDQNLSQSTASGNVYNEGTVAAPRFSDFVPVDSFNFTLLVQTPGISAGGNYTGTVWHYERLDDGTQPFTCVYPGLMLPQSTTCFHSGTYTNTITGPTYRDAVTAGNEVTNGTPNAPGAAGDASEANPFPPMQLANVDWPSPGAGTVVSPLGAFTRNGDILQVPFIGAYQIRDGSQTAAALNFEEMNPVTIDCSFCDVQNRITTTGGAGPLGTRDTTDTLDSGAQIVEQLGRFCPIAPTSAILAKIDDYDWTGVYDKNTTVTRTEWRYHFAEKLFDYLTVQSPDSDYKPNVNPTAYGSPTGAGTNISPVKNGIDSTANPATGTALPPTNNGEEMSLGVDGLVNINTAPWWVLASLPLLPNDIAGADANKNGFPDNIEKLAKQIVTWRDGTSVSGSAHGPFRSIFDLNHVTDTAGAYVFQNALAINGRTTPLDDMDGDFSPSGQGNTDSVTGDFEEKYLMLDRISNLITTRSDTFTVYIVVQGWRNVGNPAAAQLVTQRRAAFILDRSNITGVSGAENPKKTTVSTD